MPVPPYVGSYHHPLGNHPDWLPILQFINGGSVWLRLALFIAQQLEPSKQNSERVAWFADSFCHCIILLARFIAKFQISILELAFFISGKKIVKPEKVGSFHCH